MSVVSGREGCESNEERRNKHSKRRSNEDATLLMDREPVLKKPVLATSNAALVKPSKGEAEAGRGKAKKSFVYKYGNYRGYYGYRLDEFGNDARMSQFEEAWFRDKRVLDIGCNAGVVAIRVSKSFGCRSMIGVDIDKGLVDRAKRNLEIEEFAVEDEEASSEPKARKFHGGGKVTSFKASSHGSAAVTLDREDQRGEGSGRDIQFEHCNYLERESKAESFDTILWCVNREMGLNIEKKEAEKTKMRKMTIIEPFPI